MRQLFCILSLFTTTSFFAQNSKLDVEQIQLEANQLYSYRMMEWRGNDLIAANEELKTQVADYILYHDAHHLHMLLIDHTYKNKIGKFSFDMQGIESKLEFDDTKAPLSLEELKHYQTYQKMLKNISKEVKEKVETKEGFWANTMLIKQDEGYKLYLFSNTRIQRIIPLGNDAVFIGDEQGKIKSSEWYHEGLVEIPVSREGVVLSTHKHEENQAPISPTEIASFRFYGLLYGMMQMPILLPNQGILLSYNSIENKISSLYTKK